jgi:acyl carrier protein
VFFGGGRRGQALMVSLAYYSDGCIGRVVRSSRVFPPQETVMVQTLEAVSQMLSEVCEVEASLIRPEANIVDELNVDSLAFLDLTYEIDKKFGIKLPVQDWVEAVNRGAASPAEFFELRSLVAHIDRLVAESAGAKGM